MGNDLLSPRRISGDAPRRADDSRAMDALTSDFLRYRDRGDVDALAAVFDGAAGRLASLALLLSGQRTDAEDLVQATFLLAIRKASTFDPARPLMPWLCGLLEGEANNLRRRHHRDRAGALPELHTPEAGPLDASERRELVAALREHVDRLPHEQRQVLLLQLQHGLQAVEVAEVLGLAPGTVRMRIHRGLAALRRWLPASLAVWLASQLPARGMAMVRAEVLRAGALAAPALAIGGGILMKKAIAATGVLVLVALGCWAALGAPFAAAGEAPMRADHVRVTAELPTNATAPTTEPGDATTQRTAASASPDASTPATGSLLLRVVSYEQHEPMRYASAILAPLGNGADVERMRRTASTDAQGEARIDGLEPGEFEVVVLCGGHQRLTIEAGRETVATAEIMVGNPARGRVVLPDGRPAGGATIVLCSDGDAFDACRADAEGRFDLPAVYPFHRVGARLAGFAPSALHALGERELRLELPGPAATLLGSVVDERGQPVPGARVSVRSEQAPEKWLAGDGEELWRGGDRIVSSDSDGTFRVETGPGRQRLRALAKDLAPGEELVDARPDAVTPVRLVLRRCEPLSGRVVDESGQPLVGVSVHLERRDGPSRTTDDGGAFVFADAPPAVQVLWCLAPTIEPLRVERPAHVHGPWQLTAKPLTRWRLRFVDEAGDALAGWWIHGQPSRDPEQGARTDDAGRAELLAPREGCGLSLRRPRGKFLQIEVGWPTDADPSRETTVVVPATAHAAAIVRGRCVDAQGAPATDVEFELRRVGSEMPSGMPMPEERGSALASDEDSTPRPAAAGAFAFAAEAGDHELLVHCHGLPDLVVAVHGLHRGEERDLGTLRLPACGTIAFAFAMPGGAQPLDVQVAFTDAAGRTTSTAWSDGADRRWPAGEFRYQITSSNALWRTGSCTVAAGARTVLALTLTPAVMDHLVVPPPNRAGSTADGRVDYTLRDPVGDIAAQGAWTPYEGGALHLDLPMVAGRWSIELRASDGRRGVATLEHDGLVRAAPRTFPVAELR